MAVILCISLVLCSCGDLFEEALPEIDISIFSSSEPTPRPEVTLPPVAEILFGLPYDPAEDIWPDHKMSPVNTDLCSLVFDTLFTMDAQYRAQPALCDSYTVSGVKYSLHIREGVRFHDGSLLTAQDVAYTLTSIRAHPDGPYFPRIKDIESYTVRDEHTLEITLRQASNALPARLCIPVIKDGSVPSDMLNGTGRYKIMREGESMYLHYNAGWWGESWPPSIGKIQLCKLTVDDKPFDSLDAGVIGLVNMAGDFRDDELKTGKYGLITYDTLEFSFIAFNKKRPPLDSAVLRLAISRFIDRQALIDAYLGGYGLPAALPISPESAYYSQEAASILSDSSSAADGLEAGGYTLEDGVYLAPNGSPVVLKLLAHVKQLSQAQNVAAALTENGIATEVVTMAWDDYLAAVESGDFDMYYGCMLLSPDMPSESLFTAAGTLNYGKLSGSALDSAVTAFRTAFNDEAVSEAAVGMWAEYAKLVPVAPLFFTCGVLVTGNVRNVVPVNSSAYENIYAWTVPRASAQD